MIVCASLQDLLIFLLEVLLFVVILQFHYPKQVHNSPRWRKSDIFLPMYLNSSMNLWKNFCDKLRYCEAPMLSKLFVFLLLCLCWRMNSCGLETIQNVLQPLSCSTGFDSWDMPVSSKLINASFACTLLLICVFTVLHLQARVLWIIHLLVQLHLDAVEVYI